MITEKVLRAEDVRHETVKVIREHLCLKANGYRCDTEMIWNVVVQAATEQVSVEGACQALQDTTCGNSVRGYLNQGLPVSDLRQQERAVNEALVAMLPSEMPRQGLEAVMDWHDEPFYGKQPHLLAYACRGPGTHGTTYFYRIASLYLIWRQVRVTLALTYVLPEDTTLDVLQRLYERMRQLGFRPGVLYLDKGFRATAIIRYLTAQQQPTIIAYPIRGKDGGTKALCRGNTSYRTVYTFTDKDKTQAQFGIVLTLVPDKTGKRRRKWVAFVLIHMDWPLPKVYRRYRRRFGIESSYRIMRQVKILTCSRNPALRFLFLALGLLLINVWSCLRWLFARVPGPGPRRLDPTSFDFHRFVRFLNHAISRLYRPIDTLFSYA